MPDRQVPAASTRAPMIGVGLPRTGTAFLAGAPVAPLRSQHEFDSRRHCIVAAQYLMGEIPDEVLAKYLRSRSQLGRLDADVSSLNAHGAHIRAQIDPTARFVLTIRPPMDWVDAFARHKAWRPTVRPQWEYLRRARLRPDLWPARDGDAVLIAAGLGSLDGLINYWATHVRGALAGVPEGDLLVLHTAELDTCLDAVADFLGWQPQWLARPRLRNAAPRAFRTAPPPSSQLPAEHVAEVLERHLVGIDWGRLRLASPVP